MKWLRYVKLHKTKIRLLYWSGVTLFMVFVVLPMFFFFYRFNENQVRQMIVDQFDNNNYHVEVNGQVIPKFWHGLSLEINDVSVATKSDATLLHVNTINCQLSWFELALGRYQVKRISLNGVDIDEKNVMNYGLGNLLNLSKLPNSAFNAIRKINISGIQTIGSNLAYKINQGSIMVEQNGALASFSLGLKLAGQNTYILANGGLSSLNNDVIKFNNFNMQVYNDNLQMNVIADTSYQLQSKKLMLKNLKGRLVINDYSGSLSADELALSLIEGEAKNGKINLNFNNDFASQKINISFNQLLSPGFNQVLIDQLQFQYAAGMQGNELAINSILEKVQMNANAHITSATCVNEVSFSSPKLANGGLKSVLSGSCEYVANQSLLNLNLTGNLNQAPLKLGLKIYNDKPKPYVMVMGTIADLDFSRLMVDKDRLLPLYYDDSQLPFSWLSLIDMQANLAIQHFSLDRIDLNNVATQFSVVNDKLTITKMQADVYGGVLNGSAQISKLKDNYAIEAKQTIRNLDIQNLFNDLFDVQAISGKANLTLNVFANNVNSYADLHKRLNGKIIIDANHGAFQGIDFNLFVNPSGMSLSTAKSTMFERLIAQLNFTNGISKNGVVNFFSPYVIATGSGLLDFVTTTINYDMSIKSALPQNEQKISSVLIPVSITGDLFNPKVNIQNIHLFTKQPQPLKVNKHNEKNNRLLKANKAKLNKSSRVKQHIKVYVKPN